MASIAAAPTVSSINEWYAAAAAAHFECGFGHSFKKRVNVVCERFQFGCIFLFILEKLDIADQIRLALVDVIDQPEPDKAERQDIRAAVVKRFRFANFGHAADGSERRAFVE